MKQKIDFKITALTQILILVVALFAFAWMVGSSFGEVSASDTSESLPGIGESCGASGTGLCRYYSSIKTTGDSCTAGSGKTGTVQTGLCSGDEHVVCCIPTDDTSTTTSSSSSSSSGSSISSIMTTAVTSTVTEKATTSLTNFAKSKLGTGAAEKAAETGGASWGKTLITFMSGGTSSTLATIAAGGVWAAVAYGVGFYVGQWIGLDTYNSRALGAAFAAGTAVAYTLVVIGVSGTLAATGVGIVVAAVVFLIFAKSSSKDVLTYNCYLWDAETGGKNCESCNDQDIACTEYQCMSLGQGCEYSVDADTGQALCTWANENDIKPAEISAWDDALINSNYEYTPNDAISPPDEGVILVYNDPNNSSETCAPAWTQVSFGITLNERARCKYSLGTIYDDYDSMPNLYLGNGQRLYNHSMQLSLPTTAALAAENITVENGGVYEFYFMCQDSNGNTNSASYGIKFCIQDGPDTTAPIIEETYPPTGDPFGAGVTEQAVTMYVNEPSECRWDIIDRSYEDMQNQFDCDTDATQMNSRGYYECSTTLNGLEDNKENTFYFRCKDQPQLEGTEDESGRNTNAQSYEYTLVGTDELVIKSISPDNETIYSSTSPVKVKLNVTTTLGYDDGKAICSLRDNNADSGSFVEFYYGIGVERYSQYKHSQTLSLEEGDYNYTIRCCDYAGNCDQENTDFSVKTDTTAPEVVRAYKSGNYLKLITNEDAECVYSTTSCSYSFSDDGIALETPSGDLDTEHYTDWDLNKNLYIKCKDGFGNKPASDSCTIIAKATEIPELK